ncbi:Polyprenol reductase 1-like protein [Cladobotryum mycophilum]|uniref:Polyprenal reductase n=1 Tax=Cladobotryum mycophilum TaxID=491253 RepID=A0ABR0SCZ9_9HYPO
MDQIEPLLGQLASLSPSQYCQAFFILSAAFVLSLQALPDDMRKALMDYGARRPKDGERTEKKTFLDVVTSYGQVPHRWFMHFYIVSLSWSVFWAAQYVQKGSAMRFLAQKQVSSSGREVFYDVDLGRTLISWVLMSFQGSRRLYECFFVTKPGSTPMWFVHWALGLVFYTTMGASVWIEGSDAILESWKSPQGVQILTPRNLFGIAVFFFAWFKQSQFHRHLASLKKYTLPSDSWFQYIVCPHYTTECLLYLGLAFVAAPPGSLFNKSVLCGLAFVASNLGATAHGTKQWYASKFGTDQVAPRWKMIPFVF